MSWNCVFALHELKPSSFSYPPCTPESGHTPLPKPPPCLVLGHRTRSKRPLPFLLLALHAPTPDPPPPYSHYLVHYVSILLAHLSFLYHTAAAAAAATLTHQMYRTNLGAPPSPRETGLDKNGGAATNGGGGGHERRSNGAGMDGVGALAATVQEAEDLEALLTGQAGTTSGMNGGGATYRMVGVTPPA